MQFASHPTRRVHTTPPDQAWHTARVGPEGWQSGFAPRGRRFYHRFVIIDRPLMAAEWAMVCTFVRRSERDDLYHRFGYPFDSQDHPTLRRFFDIGSSAGEMIWSIDEEGEISGIGHHMRLSLSEAEFGLIVRSDLKQCGIGKALLKEMLGRSARQGITLLKACVLRENRIALLLARKQGFAPRQPFGAAISLSVELLLDLMTLDRKFDGRLSAV